MNVFIWTSYSRFYKHQDDTAQSIPDQFHHLSRHKKAMSLTKQCTIQQLASMPFAKQQVSTIVKHRSQDHPQCTDDLHKGDNCFTISTVYKHI